MPDLTRKEIIKILAQPRWFLDAKGKEICNISLKGVNLERLDLGSLDFNGINLSEADLNYANLSGANLEYANLSHADFSGADLKEADLSYADLGYANLSGANFSGADLSETKFYGADFSGADLRATVLDKVVEEKTIELKLPNSTKKSTTKKINFKPYYLFFDTETTGLPKNFNAPISDFNNWPRLVQLAWLLYDSEGKLIIKRESVIKPKGFRIPKGSSDVHGITTEYALSKGRDLIDVLDEFKAQCEKSKLLIAHNMNFDAKVMGAEFLRNNYNNPISNLEKVCTM